MIKRYVETGSLQISNQIKLDCLHYPCLGIATITNSFQECLTCIISVVTCCSAAISSTGIKRLNITNSRFKMSQFVHLDNIAKFNPNFKGSDWTPVYENKFWLMCIQIHAMNSMAVWLLKLYAHICTHNLSISNIFIHFIYFSKCKRGPLSCVLKGIKDVY